MTECALQLLSVFLCKGRVVEAGFSGGEFTSKDGVLRLRQTDRSLELDERMAKAPCDPRRQANLCA